MSVLHLLSDFESTGALKKVQSSLWMQFFVACYVVCITYADLPNKPLKTHSVSATKFSLLAPDLPLPADLPVFSRPHQKDLYTNPSPNLVVAPAQPPYYGPLITSAHSPSRSSRVSRRSMEDNILVPHSARLASPHTAEISPTQSGDGTIPASLTQPPLSPYTSNCCGPDLVLKRGTRGCDCVYPMKLDMLLINVSANPNWNRFLQEFAFQLRLQDSQINPINFYVVTLSNWNISLDITPYKGISFSASEASGINSSLSMHRVHFDPKLVGDYKLLNITWFKSLAPSQAPLAAKPPVEVPPHKPSSPAALVTSRKGKHPNLVLIVGIGAGILIIGIISVLIVCSCTSRKGKEKESPVKTG